MAGYSGGPGIEPWSPEYMIPIMSFIIAREHPYWSVVYHSTGQRTTSTSSNYSKSAPAFQIVHMVQPTLHTIWVSAFRKLRLAEKLQGRRALSIVPPSLEILPIGRSVQKKRVMNSVVNGYNRSPSNRFCLFCSALSSKVG